LTPCCGLEVQKPTQALSDLKAREISLIQSPSGQNFAVGNFSWNIRPPTLHNLFSNIKVDIGHPT